MKLLKFVAFIVLVVSVNADYPKEAEEEYNIMISECRGKYKMTDEEYTKLRYDQIANPDENMQCLINCFMEKAGVIKDGKLQPDGALKLLIKKAGEDKAKIIFDKCRNESGAKKCETAYKLHKCNIQNKAY